MKKTIFSIFNIALITTFFIVSCKKNNEYFTKSLSEDNIEYYCTEVGIEHNIGLEYIYEKLEQAKSESDFNNIDEVYGLAKNYMIEFLQNNQKGFVQENIDKSIFEAIKYWNNTTQLNPDKIWTEEVEDSLTINQILFLGVLNEAINDSTLNLEETIAIFEDVRERIKNECEEDESYLILMAIEIGVNSLTYWHTNFDRWIALFETPNKAANPDDWKQLGKADINAGVSTAAGIGIARCFGPVGWKVWAAGTLGGALAGSVNDALNRIW